MVTQMPSFKLLCFSLVEESAVDLAKLAREGIVSSFRADLAGLKHLIVLNLYLCTFLEKRSCLEVACQYSREPSECVARNACLSSLFGFMASPVTGEGSWLLRTN